MSKNSETREAIIARVRRDVERRLRDLPEPDRRANSADRLEPALRSLSGGSASPS